MKITRIETIPFAIPYRKPLRFASGEVTRAEHVLVRVHTDDGLTGVAEAPPRPYTYGETQASILAVIRTVFAPQVTGLSPLGRMVRPEEVAETCVFLASGGSATITGEDLNVTAGVVMY